MFGRYNDLKAWRHNAYWLPVMVQRGKKKGEALDACVCVCESAQVLDDTGVFLWTQYTRKTVLKSACPVISLALGSLHLDAPFI